MSQKDLGQMTLEERYEYYKSILEDMTISHDIFMKNVFTKIECVEYVLQVIMNKKDLKVKSRHVDAGFALQESQRFS